MGIKREKRETGQNLQAFTTTKDEMLHWPCKTGFTLSAHIDKCHFSCPLPLYVGFMQLESKLKVAFC